MSVRSKYSLKARRHITPSVRPVYMLSMGSNCTPSVSLSLTGVQFLSSPICLGVPFRVLNISRGWRLEPGVCWILQQTPERLGKCVCLLRSGIKITERANKFCLSISHTFPSNLHLLIYSSSCCSKHL